jgi:hypothetical protein
VKLVARSGSLAESAWLQRFWEGKRGAVLPLIALIFALLAVLQFRTASSQHRSSTSLFASVKPEHATSTKLGVALIPRNFPRSNPADIEEAFSLAAKIGSYTTFIVQWHELDLKRVRFLLERSQNAGMAMIVCLSPTSLDQGRKELDLPAEVRERAGKNITFANPVIQGAFKKAARELAELRPAYLCLATEINLLAFGRTPEFLRFARLYKDAYQEVKRISPKTKVFVSFQWDWARVLDQKEADKIDEHSKLFDIFRPELDVVALTSYPAVFYKIPAELPPDYYSSLDKHVMPNDQVFFTEIGWPSSGTGNEEQQLAFIRRLPELLNDTKVNVLFGRCSMTLTWRYSVPT